MTSGWKWKITSVYNIWNNSEPNLLTHRLITLALIELATSAGSIYCIYLWELALILLVIRELSEILTSYFFIQTSQIIEAVLCIIIGILMIWLPKQYHRIKEVILHFLHNLMAPFNMSVCNYPLNLECVENYLSSQIYTYISLLQVSCMHWSDN